MTRLKTRLLCISFAAAIITFRWVTMDNPLPAGWTAESPISITVRILEPPEHTDSKTIIRRGLWILRFDGYHTLPLGALYRFIGTVEPTVLGKKVTKISMNNPCFVAMEQAGSRYLSPSEKVVLMLARIRERMLTSLRTQLPEPHASLAAGILLGVRGNFPSKFFTALTNSGTTHVIAASGYNVSIVIQTIFAVFVPVLGRMITIPIALVTVILYVLVAGASASVVRAGVMGGLTLIAQVLGRPPLAKWFLFMTVVVMLSFSPRLLVDVGFQLSVAATAGILYLELYIRRGLIAISGKGRRIQAILSDYLSPTLAASISTLPIILWYFGKISWISPITNILILPVVPLIMFLTALGILCYPVPAVGTLISWVLYVPLEWMVMIIELLG